MSATFSELGNQIHETSETFDTGRRIESLDDITREIADRRIHAEFGESIDPERSQFLREIPDRIENDEEFEKAAQVHGIDDTEGLRGFATRAEDPAYLRRMEDVATRIGTESHEDLHRLTHPETLRESSENPVLNQFYEGLTEYFSAQAMDGLHEYQPGEVYPEQVESVRQIAEEVGEQSLRDWFFKHEACEELQKALDRLATHPRQAKTQSFDFQRNLTKKS